MRKERKTKENRGITLIALIVTIIVLLILAGISISMLTGQNGILNKAAEAKERTEIASIKEQIQIEIFGKQAENAGEITKTQFVEILNKYFEPEITEEDLPEDLTTLILETKKEYGKYEIKIGEIYKGGFSGEAETLQKGKIVTGSNVEWQDGTNEYPAIIPVGFCVVTDAETINEGLVISDVPDDDMENTKHGNQFVWIPVNDYSKFHLIEGYYNESLQNYLSQTTNSSREAGDTLNVAGSPMEKNSTKGTAESQAMYNSVKNNHGFYIARFEAGIAGTTDNYSLTDKKVADGKTPPLSQKGVGVWNAIPWGGTSSDTALDDGLPGDDTADGAVKVARSMYTKSATCGVTSTLCYGVQWDAVMNFIDPNYVKEEGNLTSFVADSTGKGNYNEDANTNTWKNQITTTGKISNYAEKNIYDLAGNVFEWTMEAYDSNVRVGRGGGGSNAGSKDPASLRYGDDPDNSYGDLGLRVALYL